MHFLRAFVNLSLGAFGGLLGNLLAAWWQQDVWQNAFTLSRLLATVVGLVATLLLLAWLDASVNPAKPVSPSRQAGVRNNVQIGNPLIRVLKGTNVYGNWQIGSGKIEVIESKSPTPRNEKRTKDG